MHNFFILLLFLSFMTTVSGQDAEGTYLNKVFNEKIKTVQLHKEGWNLSYPVIRLNSEEKLIFHFDLLADQPETFYYTFIHCDKDWKKSDIFTNDYLDGFEENPVEDYKASFNTTAHYFHYNLTFPNESVNLKVSGNYILLVYLSGQKENPEMMQRFVITEDAVKFEVNAHRPKMTANNNTHQQLDFSVDLTGMNLNDPDRNIYAFILQNGRWNNAIKNLKSDFYGNNKLNYSSLSDKNIFPGGNEYRYFDIKSIRYKTEFVRDIEFAVPNYNVYLSPSENRQFKPYFYWQDFNGKYYIAVQEGRDHDTDADYVYVYFTLPSKERIAGGDMYVSGALSNWEFNRMNLMAYNNEARQYECTMMLKQGWYNFEYIYLGKGETSASPGLFEGNHFETENDYLILIYYRNPRERYDRVLGTVVTNTLNRLSD